MNPRDRLSDEAGFAHGANAEAAAAFGGDAELVHDPAKLPPGGIWTYLSCASERMVAHERRREARWRKGVPA